MAVAADALLDQALAAGAPDNVSVALLRVGSMLPVAAPRVIKGNRSTRRTALIACAVILVAVIVWLLVQFVRA